MDPVTQTALGAIAAQCCARPGRQGRAALAGGIGGFIPDADVLIRSSEDPLLFLEMHRQFTHSLLFIPVGALIAAGLAWLILRRRVPWRQLYLPALLGYATHGLLDACTSYGTQLFWPFAGTRVAWNVVAILDPLFTLPLLWGVARAVRRDSRATACKFLGVGLVYLGLCTHQHGRAYDAQAELITSRGHEAQRRQAKPSILNNVLFRAYYQHGDDYYVDAIRVPWFGDVRVVEGVRHPLLDLEAFLLRFPLDELQREDVERFRRFSDGYLIEHPELDGVIADLRYAALPDAVAPLWGVDANGLQPGQHLGYRSFTGLDAAQRAHFLDLLLGREPEPRPRP